MRHTPARPSSQHPHTAQPACPGNWVVDAACADRVDDFTIDSRRYKRGGTYRTQIAAAKKICRSCPVLEPCRDWALTSPDPAYEMIAAAMTPAERRQARRREGVA